MDDDVLTQGNVGAPTGYTLDFLFANTQSTATMMVAHKVLTVAATENPGAFTDTGGNTDSYVAETIALRFELLVQPLMILSLVRVVLKLLPKIL